jgi:TolB-like protein/Tfp pilus assembly protein PilF
MRYRGGRVAGNLPGVCHFRAVVKPEPRMEVIMSETTTQRIERLMKDETVQDLLAENARAKKRIENAIEYLIKKHKPADKDILRTLWRFREPILEERITAFCSYKKKDESIARELEILFSKWTSGRMQMKHMEKFRTGEDWRKQIREIPNADWFLLLMPGPEADRDWPLFEAGYFRPGGPTLSRRLVCLHHPDNEVTDVLGDHQSVPAELNKVERFLKELLIEPNWIPGLPPVNPVYEKEELTSMAQEIVNLIRPPSNDRRCCGAHMRIDFENIKGLSGWELLAKGNVRDVNDDFKELFGFARDPIKETDLQFWLQDVEGVGRDEGWVMELAEAVREVAGKRSVPQLNSVLAMPEGRFVQPKICAVTRKKDDSLETIDFLFLKTPPPQDHSPMSPEFSTMATILEFTVEFRSILEKSASQRLGRKNIKDFESALEKLESTAARNPHLTADPEENRRLIVSLFEGSDRDDIEQLLDKWETMRRPDGTGVLDRTLKQLDAQNFQKLLEDLRQINQQFLELLSARFSDIVTSPERAWVDSREPSPPAVRPPTPPRRVDPRSIGVLPFENLSADPKDVFADGMTEEVISRLAQVEGLTVLSRFAVMDYKRTTKTQRQIAEELEVAYLLEGSVRREDHRVRITGQLIEAKTGKHIWAQTYEKELDSVFAVQSDVAQAITSALDVKISARERAALEKSPTGNLAAYEVYLKGMQHYARYRRDDNENAIKFWEQALAKDPQYALAQAGLAKAYYQRQARFGFPMRKSIETGLKAAERAVELDPQLSEAYDALGSVLGALGQTKKALEAELKAIKLKPSDQIAIMNAGCSYEDMGKLDESLRYKKRALDLNPLSSNSCSQLGYTYMLLSMDAVADKWLQYAIKLEPGTVQARAFLAQLHMAKGEDEKALEQAQAILTRYPNEPMGLKAAGHAHWFAGRTSEAATYFRQNMEQARIELAQIAWSVGHREEANKLLAPSVAFLEKILARGGEASWVYRKLAATHAVREERDKANERLERAVETGEVDYRKLQRLPVFAGMRADQRFQECVAEMRSRVAEMRVKVEAQETGRAEEWVPA